MNVDRIGVDDELNLDHLNGALSAEPTFTVFRFLKGEGL